jgi:hypothetical protein
MKVCILIVLTLGAALAFGQSVEPPQTVTLIGCVSGGNLQPVEQPFVLEPSEPFVLVDILTEASTFAPANYRVTGINMAPWLGMRVKVQGAVIPPPAGAAGSPKGLPEIKATLVHSTWGTCLSPATWTPRDGGSAQTANDKE